jgi:hypothetical protein
MRTFAEYCALAVALFTVVVNVLNWTRVRRDLTSTSHIPDQRAPVDLSLAMTPAVRIVPGDGAGPVPAAPPPRSS